LALLPLAGNGCAPQPEPPAAAADAAKKLPVFDLDEKPAFPLEKHVESKDIAAGAVSYEQLFVAGAKLFHTPYNGLDGVGMMRTVGGVPLHRFSTGPAGGGQPIPVAAQSCGSCHKFPFDAGAGLVHTRVTVDPGQKALPPFNVRGTTSLFGDGVLQLLAQEMTEQLLAGRDTAAQRAKTTPGVSVRQELSANGVGFGAVSAKANANGEVSFDLSEVRGVSPDLVVRPMGWKGSFPTVRDFTVAASVFGMGMMGEEFAWRLGDKAGPDPDGDGVSREFSVGDVTAITIYTAAQEAPTEIGRLASLGLVAAPDAATTARIEQGRELFGRVGCTNCHVAEMKLANTVFEEPTLAGGGNYIDGFLAGKDPDYDPKRPAKVDLLKDSQEPRIEAAPGGGAIVRLYGDLKRHEMGRQLADPGPPQAPFDAALSPLKVNDKVAALTPSEFLTAELWGVGSTGLWLHDDRAGSLAEAIALHGEDAPKAPGEPGRSEAQEVRDAYLKLTPEEQRAVVTFLKSLLTFAADGK
jgi:hypothetical protein